MTLFKLQPGTTPLLVNVPHSGTVLPEAIAARMTPLARTLPDTDWYVDRLYDFATAMGAGMLVASHSRYVVDLNRPPDDAALYNTRTTGLVPVETFDGEALYRPGQAPDADEIAERRDRYWAPVHDALAAELARLRAQHGYAILLDAHSIRGEVPALFDGVLADLNLGSHGGRSAAPGLVDLSMDVFRQSASHTAVLDGRFKGGYNTRHYGQPGQGIHALQMEMPQRLYMSEAPPAWEDARAAGVVPLLRQWLQALLDWRPEE
ncbi:N-formylglutamate deformylase [Marinihelvus fidelis]|uniref:N-formylglutamate deformylase n=1 Tax=Marinihelvus fidelis TaxID=2613842 RepID=A0A5N0T8A5_9GAMM|nr:N-formylglutamate deformylase [Marinihelvus fidelis]KAA9131265.1 N-formylglutamate deformylase [Marinihelvus fidelis]